MIDHLTARLIGKLNGSQTLSNSFHQDLHAEKPDDGTVLDSDRADDVCSRSLIDQTRVHR